MRSSKVTCRSLKRRLVMTNESIHDFSATACPSFAHSRLMIMISREHSIPVGTLLHLARPQGYNIGCHPVRKDWRIGQT